ELAAGSVEETANGNRAAWMDVVGLYVCDAQAQPDIRGPLRAGIEIVQHVHHEVVGRQAAGSRLGSIHGVDRAGTVVTIVVLELYARAAERVAHLDTRRIAQVVGHGVVSSASARIVKRWYGAIAVCLRIYEVGRPSHTAVDCGVRSLGRV